MRLDLDDIRRRASILALLPSDCGPPQRAGSGRWRARCPLHRGDGRSFGFGVGERGWWFNCFACGEHGGAIDLVMKLECVPFREAAARLSGRDLGPAVPLWQKPAARFAMVCDGPGCIAFIDVTDERDLAFLGGRQDWHVNTYGPSFCWRCLRRRRIEKLGAPSGPVPDGSSRQADAKQASRSPAGQMAGDREQRSIAGTAALTFAGDVDATAVHVGGRNETPATAARLATSQGVAMRTGLGPASRHTGPSEPGSNTAQRRDPTGLSR